MKISGLKSYLVITLISIVMLSIAWNWVGKGYVALLVHSVPSRANANVTIEQTGDEIRITVRSLTRPTGIRTQVNWKQLTYGLIPGIAVLLFIPRLTHRSRLVLLAVTVLVGFTANAVGLEVLIREQVSRVQDGGSTEGLFILSRTVSFLMPLAPSIVWVPAVYVGWKKASEPEVGSHVRRRRHGATSRSGRHPSLR